jgi:thiamine monophosphate synthase
MIPATRIAALKVCAISAGSGDPESVLLQMRGAIAGGVRTVVVREPALLARARDARHVSESLRRELPIGDGLLLWSSGGSRAELGVIAELDCDGVQLRASAPAIARVRRHLPAAAWLGRSVHDEAEIDRSIGANHLILAPIFPTPSKPGHPGLGTARAVALTRRAPAPVVWLGGIDERRLAAMRPPLPMVGFAFLHRDWASTVPQTRALVAEAAAVMVRDE